MDLSLLPTPASEYNKQRAGARFTVRSASSPSYRLTRRPGVRKPKGFSEEEGEKRESVEELGEREGHATNIGANVTNEEEDHKVAGHHAMSAKPSQNGTADKTVGEFGADRSGNLASEGRGRTESRRSNLLSRSKSLDWRTGERSPDRGRRVDVFMLSTRRVGDASKQAGSLDGGRTGVEGIRSRVMFSVQAHNCAGASNVAPDRSPVSHVSQTLDRTTRGHSLPSRLRTQPVVRGTAPSFVDNGGQSILERIEKLYGSAAFGRTEDSGKTRDFSTPGLTSHHKETTTDSLISPQQRSHERATGGTFPRRFSSGERKSLSPVHSIKPFTWTQKDNAGYSPSLSSGTSRTRERLSVGQWQGPIQGRYSEGKGLEDIGTRSLDRARSRFTVAAQIRSARAAGGITAPAKSNTSVEEDRPASLRDFSGSRESKDRGGVDHGEEKDETDGTNGTLRERTGQEQEREKETDDGAKDKTELRSSGTDEDVFESNPQRITTKAIERKTRVGSAASVRNKINQFEALTQRAQGLASGQVLGPRRAFSVPAQLSRVEGGVKESGSAKAMGGLRDKWRSLKERGEAGDKMEGKVTGAGKTPGSERSSSLDEVGLRLESRERERDDSVENKGKETDSGSNGAEDFDKYSRLKRTLEIPLNEGAQRQREKFHADETDFSKVSSPEKTSERPPSNPRDAPAGAQKTSSGVTSPVSDEDKTPTNTPSHSPFLLSPVTQPENAASSADIESESDPVVSPEPDPSPVPGALVPSSHRSLPELVSPDVRAACPSGKKPGFDLDAWVAGLEPKVDVWNDDEDNCEDDDDSTQKDEDSNYDSDSGESSVTITSNASLSDRKSFCVSLSDLCNFAGVDSESENDDEDEWKYTGRRSASLSSDMSALSCVSVLPSEELDRLLEDVRSLGDSTLQDYDDVQVVVLHKEVAAGLGFSLAGGVDQNKPITVHKVFHSGVAAKEGSIREGDRVLSINGTALCGYAHWEALRVLRRAKTRDLGVVVLKRGEVSSVFEGGAQTNNQGPTQTELTETGQRVCVRLEKNSRDLGFSLQGGVGSGQENRPLTVQKIFQGGPVDKVFPGDEVVEIGDVSMVGMRRLEAWTLIRRLPPGPVDVVLRRPLKHQETGTLLEFSD